MNVQELICTKSESTEIYLRVFSENLNHSRHVENERQMFSSVYIAMSGAFLAFATNLGSKPTTLMILITTVMDIIMILLGVITILVTRKWNYVFECHKLQFTRDYTG